MCPSGDANSALLMDEGLPLGNTEDRFTRRALHVKIGNQDAEAVPVYITQGGTPRNIYSEALAVPSGSETAVVTYTVPVGKTLHLFRAQFSGENIATYRVKIDGTTVALQRQWWTDGLSGEIRFDAGRGLPCPAGSVVTVTALHQRPSAANFSARIQGVEES